MELPPAVVEDLSEEEAVELGRRAARAAIAPHVWSSGIGQTIDTASLCDVLGVTRQALNKRMAAGSLLGLPRRGSTSFPTWQIDVDRKQIRPEVRDITAPFLEEFGKVDHFLVLAWAGSEQDDLDGETPLAWVVQGRDRNQLITAARRAVSRLAT